MDRAAGTDFKGGKPVTLFKQIAVLIALGFLLLYLLLSADVMRQSSRGVNDQLQTTVQDTATVLAVAISNTDALNDNSQLETLLNAVFDSGYYSRIRLQTADKQKALFDKRRDLVAQDVPSWFKEVVALKEMTGKAAVMSGWAPVANLEVTLHPGFTYTNLYLQLKSTLIWVFSIFLITLGLLWLFLHSLLKPLRLLERQAQAVQNNDFDTLNDMPRTSELKRIVLAMNRLTTAAKHNFDGQQSALQDSDRLLHRDELTGLKNRRFIMRELQLACTEEARFNGCAALIRLHGVDTLRAKQNYQEADDVIKLCARID